MYALRWIIVEPLRLIAQCLAWPFVIIPFQTGRGLWAIWPLVPVTYICLSIATGDWGLPARFAELAGVWLLRHTDLLYLGLRVICGVFVVFAVLVMAVTFRDAVFPPQPDILRPVNHAYGATAIDNFRDRSAYGDAQHAKRQDIAVALAGSGGATEPFFEA